MDKDTFIYEISKLNVTLNDLQLEQLNIYYKLLVEWNSKINLTRIIEEKDVYLKHFYDSITLCRVVNLSQKMSLCDIGTGAGFPGLVLKIVFPSLKITLVDSLLKRINFLNEVINKLGLKDITTVHIRAEDFIKDHKNEFDIVTCRAVSRLSNLLKYSVPLVKKNGFFIPMKANCDEELMEAMTLVKKMNLELVQKDVFNLPIENSIRTIIKFVKLK